MATSSLKDYLKRYESKTEEDDTKKKTKKNKKKSKPVSTGVLVVDEDPVWQKQIDIQQEEEENDSADEEKPLVEEDIEVKRMRRLEQIRVRRGYDEIAEDGSGWVSLPISPKHGDVAAASLDMSPLRKRNDTPSPDPTIRHSNQDMSPPRKRRARNDTPSLERRERPTTSEAADLSPPRPQRTHQRSPLPKTESLQSDEIDADLSPPRPRRTRHYSPSPEPDVKEQENGRKVDLSPPRKRRVRNDMPSPRGNVRKNAELEDISPPRRARRSPSAKLDPARSKREDSSVSFSLKEKAKTGLVSGRDISKEISKIRKDDLLRFEQMDPSISGRGAEPVYRDKKGERISKEDYMKSKQKIEEKPKEIKIEWGKGLAQKREAEAKLQELELEKDQPFARSRDDPELDKMLKDRLRWGDPMAHLVKKKHSELVLPDFGDNEKMKESGFIIPQDIPSHSWIKRGLDAAPNRYGIKPGRHWDGVDRSSGYEKQLFKRTNEKQATEKEAYLWSVSEM